MRYIYHGECYITFSYIHYIFKIENFARRKLVERALTVSQEHMTVTR